MLRKRWEAELLAGIVVGRLAEAMGGKRSAVAPTTKARPEPGNNDRVSADTLLGMMGIKV